MAEREGFEPSVPVLAVQRFSKPSHSATLPPLLRAEKQVYHGRYKCGCRLQSQAFAMSLASLNPLGLALPSIRSGLSGKQRGAFSACPRESSPSKSVAASRAALALQRALILLYRRVALNRMSINEGLELLFRQTLEPAALGCVRVSFGDYAPKAVQGLRRPRVHLEQFH